MPKLNLRKQFYLSEACIYCEKSFGKICKGDVSKIDSHIKACGEVHGSGVHYAVPATTTTTVPNTDEVEDVTSTAMDCDADDDHCKHTTDNEPKIYEAEYFEDPRQQEQEDFDAFGRILFALCEDAKVPREIFEKIAAHVNTFLEKYGN
ncbi:unnamed protein product [Absidia cylindrospora]